MYILNYGVNNSHYAMESDTFNLYRDAVKAFNSVDSEVYKCAIIFKAHIEGKKGFKTIKELEAKIWRTEPDTDNTWFHQNVINPSL